MTRIAHVAEQYERIRLREEPVAHVLAAMFCPVGGRLIVVAVDESHREEG